MGPYVTGVPLIVYICRGPIYRTRVIAPAFNRTRIIVLISHMQVLILLYSIIIVLFIVVKYIGIFWCFISMTR
jgi:hypothetical protein